MKIATQTLEISSRFSDVAAVQMIANAGFDAVDLSLMPMSETVSPFSGDNYREYALSLLDAAKDCGITFVQSHAPFRWKGSGEGFFRENVFPMTVRSLEISSILGIPNAVVHPIHNLPYEENREYLKECNYKFFKALIPYAEQWGVVIAIENMWKRNKITGVIGSDVCSCPEEFCEYVDMLGSPMVKACLDIGHVGLCSQRAEDMIYALGGRISCLHLHDNDNKNDLHTIMGLGKIDFDKVAKALADIGYNGALTLEADNFMLGFDERMLPHCLDFMAKSAASFREKINSYKI